MVLFTSKRNTAKVLSMIFAVSIGFGSWANTNDVSVVHPPEGATIEKWDWYNKTLSDGTILSRTLDVAVLEDSVYYRLYDFGRPMSSLGEAFVIDSWIAGKVNNGKIYIKRAPELSAYEWDRTSGGPNYDSPVADKYFNPCKYWSESWGEGSRNSTYHYETLDEDIFFDYDSEKKWIHNPSCKVWVSDYFNDHQNWTGDVPLWPDPIYLNFQLMYVPDGPLTPQAPEFYLEECPYYHTKYLILTGSIFSEEGPAMHYYQLYFRIYIDGKPYTYIYDGKSITDIYWKYSGESPKEGWHLYYTHIPFDESIFKKPYNNVCAKLVYKYEDGLEVESAPTLLIDVSGVDEVFRDDMEDIDAPVYDLAGRRIRPDRLVPGIYIRNGKKFMVK